MAFHDILIIGRKIIMPRLYGQLFVNNNIREAIKTILKHQGSKTPGPDGITIKNMPSEDKVIKEVKMRLRRVTKVNSRTVEIPEPNGKVRQLTICNLYDRIAQQAVLQIIEPIIDPKFSSKNFGFRKGISAKQAVANACAVVNAAKLTYTVQIDFNKCFDNIPLDKALDDMRELGIHDSKVLATIKHLMKTSKEYNGIGLGQGTVIGPILANCYLHKIDQWAERNTGNKTLKHNNLDRHLTDFREWIEKNNKVVGGTYIRYADDIIILTTSRSEQLVVYDRLKEFIQNNLEITINEDKTIMSMNDFCFLGFHIMKFNEHINITPSDIKKLRQESSATKWRTPEEIRKSLKWILGILNYYDICNNLSWLIEKLTLRLTKIENRKTNALTKEEGRTVFYYHYNRVQYTIDLYALRRHTKISYKEYLFNQWYLKSREHIKLNNKLNPFHIYKYALFTKQRGLDPCTKRKLSFDDMEIHHIDRNRTNNRMSNLVLVSKRTHDLIHSQEQTNNSSIKRYRKFLDV